LVTAAKEARYSDQIFEVVPTTVVVDFIDIETALE
jgi:hypothetical protein